ncbi:hypothetical protein BGY98DRAFT_1181787 [Russula aff. rugulosa BPL654]|nr:hypothetical protein BGY98DRAFT_1181787 [Russula aff. rugulosa BPL654]
MNQAQGLQQSQQQVGVMQEQLVAIQGQLAALQQQLIQQHQEVIQILARINVRIQNRNILLPIRLFNAGISHESREIRYPPGIDPIPALPTSKYALRSLTVANALGLPPLEGHVHVADQRRQISDFLGCAMMF